MPPVAISQQLPESMVGPSMASHFPDLRSVRWRIFLGVLPSSLNSTFDDLRRVTADSRRRYATLRRRLLIDPQITRFADDSPDLVADNPLSQNPDSTWGRFFRNAELEQMVDKDLSRLYPEHGSYFQTPGCQGLLRRILLLWCLRHPECGYRQGMHELLAPLLYVLHTDIQHLDEVRKLYGEHFVDKFDEDLINESLDFDFKISSKSREDDNGFQERSRKRTNITDLDANVQSIILLSDPYGAEGELGVVLSEKFMEHDAYCMLEALMSGVGGPVAMADFFSHSPSSATHTGFPPVIEASLALYHLLSIVDSSLYSHLVELGVEPQYFALRWLRVLFGREFSLEDLLIIWDEIFSFDNSKLVTCERDPGVLNSPRGAFISAMAVSMILNIRSSLLATELATSCLQRLLNFPEQVDLDKLIGKAKSLVTLALDANVPSPSVPLSGNGNHNKQMSVKGHAHSMSFDSSLPGSPVSVVPESYWEEKWRLMQKEEESKKENLIIQASPRRRGWADKIKSKLSRTESDPCQSRREGRDRDKRPPVRRSLLEDLSRQLNAGEETEETGHDQLPFLEDPLSYQYDKRVKDVGQEAATFIDNRCSGVSTASEEHSPVFSEPASPVENDLEKSSSASNISHDISDGGTQRSSSFQSTVEESPLPISEAPDPDVSGTSVSCSDNNSREVSLAASKERKTLAGKFQWLWKFGRQNPGDGASDKKLDVEDSKPADDISGLENNTDTSVDAAENKAGTSVDGTEDYALTSVNMTEDNAEPSVDGTEDNAGTSVNGTEDNAGTSVDATEDNAGTPVDATDCSYVNLKTDSCDQNMIFALRNLGQSMLDNIQIIESALQQERSQAGSVDHLSKHALVEKGQATAITALKELRKISNLLREA